jgi:hypothetical protein
MQVTDLDTAEKIVDKNYFLHWDGWDILALKKTPSGQYRADGMRVGSAWYTVKRITPNEQGWDVPNKYVRI